MILRWFITRYDTDGSVHHDHAFDSYGELPLKDASIVIHDWRSEYGSGTRTKFYVKTVTHILTRGVHPVADIQTSGLTAEERFEYLNDLVEKDHHAKVTGINKERRALEYVKHEGEIVLIEEYDEVDIRPRPTPIPARLVG